MQKPAPESHTADVDNPPQSREEREAEYREFFEAFVHELEVLEAIHRDLLKGAARPLNDRKEWQYTLAFGAEELTERILERYTTNEYREARQGSPRDLQNIPIDANYKESESTQNDGKSEGMQSFETPDNLQTEELTAIQQRGIELAQAIRTVGSLGLEGVEVQMQIAAAHDLATHLEKYAKNLGMDAVSEGKLTQRQLSRLLGVAELTVGRWMKDRREDEQQNQ